jgi:HSP20 family protein
MNRLFDSVFRGLTADTSAMSWPSIEVQEKDGAYRIGAELPGLDEKDVEVSVQNGVLTIRGEKKAETEDKERQYSERHYGRFERRLALGELDEEKISASFDNGVLTVTAPKSRAAEAQAKRIPISTGQTVH